MTNGNNETIHISLGSTANYLTSHFINLQGLAATTSDSGSGDNETWRGESLCDPSVTHDVRPLDGDDGYSTHNLGASSSSLKRYAYVPRTLIIDGRDSFPRWAGGGETSHQQDVSAAWSGDITTFDPSSSLDSAILDGGIKMMDILNTDENDTIDDPLTRFRNAASAMGSSRFHATAPQRYATSSYNTGRHVEWDDDEEEEEDDFDDNDDYRAREARRRRQESTEHRSRQARKDWNRCMEDAWEETFYPTDHDGHDQIIDDEGVRSNEAMKDGTTVASDNNSGTSATTMTKNVGDTRNKEREIQWHDYWMSPMPAQSGYSVPLPFDTSNVQTDSMNNEQSSSSWSTCSTSFDAGYRSPDSGGSWREHVLSESLRKVLEGCDIVKGFNIFVDGGSHTSRPGGSKGCGGGGRRSNFSDIVAGGGYHAGLAASLMEELSEECRSAGRWAVMVDPPSSTRATQPGDGHGVEGNDVNGGAGIVDKEGDQVYRFRTCLNAGLALHGLSTNADAFLPVSIDGAYRALRSDTMGGRTASSSSTSNRILFEGSAAIALALETSTLFYRIRRYTTAATSHNSTGPPRRGRIGIQSGFYQGYSGNGYEEFDNEPFATAPSLTYHEFLACARPSSDRRRNILELDALLRPLSYPSTSSTSVGGLSSSVLASLASSGLIIGGNSNNSMGEELQRRITRGTSIEQMMMEQQRQQCSSRARVSSSRPVEPGEWLDDFSTKTCDGGGLLSSLSGNSIPFGMRSDHHHFALSTSLRPAKSDSCNLSNGDNCTTTAFLRPMMESMGVKYRPEVSLGLVVNDNVVDLTGVSSYWRSVFSDRRTSAVTPQETSEVGGVGSIIKSQSKLTKMSPITCASNTPILSVLGNSTRSYPRLNTISSGFVDALHSRRNMGYFSRDVMAGVIPEKDDCEEALEYCRELMDVYEPPLGSGLVGEDENDSGDAYFDEE